MSLLTVEDLTVRYGAFLALDRVSLPALEAGGITGVIGPNASGKSTLLRTLAEGAPHEGSVRLAERPLRELPAAERRRTCAYLPQALPQPSALYAYELVMANGRATDPGLAPRELERRVADIFDRLALGELAMKPLRQLSGGKRQLVGIALSLVRRPRLLLLDEPTSALDVRWQFVVMEQIREFVRAHAAGCLVAVHDMNIALRCCDRLVLLSNGRVAAAGSPRDVVTGETLARVYGVEADIRTLEDGRVAVAIHGPTRNGNADAQSRQQL